MRWRQKPGVDHMVDELEEGVKEAGGVDEADRFVDLGKLVHGQDLHQFLDRANAARQCDEGVGEFRHALLAKAQRRDDFA